MEEHLKGYELKFKLKAAGLHFLICMAVAIVLALIVFKKWYPHPYDAISGGRDVFLLILSVDLILGPILTMFIVSERKRRRELFSDLSVIVFIQISALVYGIWTVMMARPLFLTFEIDRFRVVHVNEVKRENTKSNVFLGKIDGPMLMGLRPFRDDNEKFEMTVEALQGVALSFQPKLWQDYDRSRSEVIKNSRSIDDLTNRFPNKEREINDVVSKTTVVIDLVGYLPIISRDKYWTVLIDVRNGDVLDYLELDSF